MNDLAYGDALTALPNRRATMLRLDEAVAAAVRHDHGVGVLYLDLDRFKPINDTYGHRAGDVILTEVGRRLRATVRRDEFVGRIGGDEFAILIPRLRAIAEAQETAQRVEAELIKPYEVESQAFDVGVSIGIATFPEDGGDADALLSNSDAAMYRAKRNPQERICFYRNGLAEELQRSRMLSENLRGATVEREFLLCYQPVIDAATGSVTSAEALLRWLHPSMGMLSPGSFLTLAKTLRLGQQLDVWVAGEALRQVKRWQSEGLRISITMNVDVVDAALLDELTRLRDIDGVDLSGLSIELHEDAALEDVTQHRGLLASTRALGVRLGLDKFGTGTTSLALLASLPIDFVKIDRSLVAPLFGEKSAERALHAAIAVASAFGWSILAEGVQTVQQREWLRDAGVSEMQGFAIAQPMTGPDLLRWHEAQHGALKP
ncbi:MAG: EAL domain-containing protein, partial [Candidatus Eremiobacteraeota bacterium]|nr:EAL domain-containing protein [Candidatus Eremiobacteraeota bacterium]